MVCLPLSVFPTRNLERDILPARALTISELQRLKVQLVYFQQEGKNPDDGWSVWLGFSEFIKTHYGPAALVALQWVITKKGLYHTKIY